MTKKLTHITGAPVADNENVMTAGPRGPQRLQDAWFLEKLAHFDREVIPERVSQRPLEGNAERSPQVDSCLDSYIYYAHPRSRKYHRH